MRFAGRGLATATLLGLPVTHPLSPHSIQVTETTDLVAVGSWSRADLAATVDAADERDRVVVVDHDRDRLYLAASDALDYRPPGPLGGGPPALDVYDPHVVTIADGTVRTDADDDVTVGPEFDVLVPAYDLAELEDPPPDRFRTVDRPAGAGTGSPG
ncbi:hypothetical protein BRD17_05135 [Halobacteriales archaeon SW_7_68_16]|nr:MAG: hypothetical protein BRD17_05135 [Halobacteriales archaeon SW_7_68_16]